MQETLLRVNELFIDAERHPSVPSERWPEVSQREKMQTNRLLQTTGIDCFDRDELMTLLMRQVLPIAGDDLAVFPVFTKRRA